MDARKPNQTVKQASINNRVQKHRAKRRAERFQRLEVWLGMDVVDSLRELATYREYDLQTLVREVLSSHLGSYSGVLELLRKKHLNGTL